MTEYKISLLTFIEAETEEEAEFLGKKALGQEVADRNFDVEEVDHQPTFEVGEYYVSNDGDIYKITSQENLLITVKLYNISSGRFLDMTIPSHDPQDKPATAEQIAEFERAEHFAAHGRKLDEFRAGDIVWDEYGMTMYVKYISDGMAYEHKEAPIGLVKYITLIQTAEELREVGE